MTRSIGQNIMKLSPLRLRLLIACLLTVSFLAAMDHTVVSTSLATIAGELGALQYMSWIVVGYTLASTVLLPVLGKLDDVLGPRKIFLGSLGTFLLASLFCGLAADFSWLITARVIQGMSAAGLQLMSQTIIARVTTQRERPRYMAMVGAAFPVAILIGPLLGGAITDYWGWPWIFWINIPLGAAALVLALFALPHLEAGSSPRGFDMAGAAVFAMSLVALILGVTWTNGQGFSLPALVCLAISLLGFITFFWIEARVSDPMIPLGFFANRTIAAGAALSAIIGVGLFSITAYLPTYIQMAYQTSVTVSGLVPIATVFGMLCSNLLTGWWASRTGHYWTFPVMGTALGSAGLLAMALLPMGQPLWVPMAVMAVVGIGTGSFMNLIVTLVQGAVPVRQTGTITATINLVRHIGSTVATAMIGAVIAVGVAGQLPPGLNASTLTPQQVHAQPAAVQAEIAGLYHTVFTPVFTILAIAYVVGVIAALCLPRGRLENTMASTEHNAIEPIPAQP
ncbi:MFS transporter [Glutamicibacter sp. MNS18]|uniref:MFS transporter n=1 Tax=Glutamicibacter sp. MNS18 TaxID=2989817 RepID=UPI002235AD64|nr:MFS transporter [Glutamicibacter sp. MNS18]MCW4466286.1 MFS transporter [Glutamicibacter sp. MNS18]